MIKSLLPTILFFLLLFTPSLAATPTATPSATPTTNLQDKIKSLVKENLDTAENLLQNGTGKSILGYTGKVKSVGIKNITLEVENDLLQVVLLPTTTITKSGSEIKPTSIALSDKLLVFGTKTKEDILEAKVISVLAPEDTENLVTTTSQIANFKNIDLKKKAFILTINGEDQNFTPSKKTTVKLDEYKNGDTILAITKKYQGKFSLSRARKI